MEFFDYFSESLLCLYTTLFLINQETKQYVKQLISFYLTDFWNEKSLCVYHFS